MDLKIIPTSVLRAQLRDAISYTKKHRQPLLITEHGEPTSVLLDIHTYQRLLKKDNNQLEKIVGEKYKEYKKRKEYGNMHDLF